MKNNSPVALKVEELPCRTTSIYPEPFASMMAGREKRALGDAFGIKNFGVNLTKLIPGARSALLHRHNIQEELIYILSGHPTLVIDADEIQLQPGMCAGFIASGPAHYLVNHSNQDVLFLEVGDRSLGDEVEYPIDDIKAVNTEGKWTFLHKDNTPYTD